MNKLPGWVYLLGETSVQKQQERLHKIEILQKEKRRLLNRGEFDKVPKIEKILAKLIKGE